MRHTTVTFMCSVHSISGGSFLKFKLSSLFVPLFILSTSLEESVKDVGSVSETGESKITSMLCVGEETV